jgi:hypothetical protein
VLWLALAARDSGTRASELVGLDAIHGPESVECLDFDLACAYRLQEYDFENDLKRDELLAKRIANEVGLMLGGKRENGSDDYGPSDNFIDPRTGEFDADAARRAGIEVV